MSRQGQRHEFLRLLPDSGHQGWVGDYVVIEARRNLIAREPDALIVFAALFKRLRINPAQAPGPELKLVNWLPEIERTVLAAAMRLRCHALVTGECTRFGPCYGKMFGDVTIHSPRSLAEYRKDGRAMRDRAAS